MPYEKSDTPPRSKNPQKDLIVKLAEDSACWRWIDSMKRKPGETILSLPTEQREILEKLTSEDMKDVVWPSITWQKR